MNQMKNRVSEFARSFTIVNFIAAINLTDSLPLFVIIFSAKGRGVRFVGIEESREAVGCLLFDTTIGTGGEGRDVVDGCCQQKLLMEGD